MPRLCFILFYYALCFIFQIMFYFTFAFKVSNNPGAFIYDSLLYIYALTKLLLYIKLTDNLHISEYRTYHQIQYIVHEECDGQ